MGLPWWRSGWESACQCRGHGFEPWSGKIPHAAEQLGPWATTTEPARLEPVLRNRRGRDSERPARCDEEWPPLATTRESPRAETKTQHSQKKKGGCRKRGGVFFTKECQQISVRFKNCHLVTLSELTESCKNHQWILKLLSDNSQVSPQISEQS